MNRELTTMLAAFVLALGASNTSAAERCSTVKECAQQAVEAALAAREAHRIAVPSGAVMAFNLPDCPVGWKPFDPASGRVIVGAGEGIRDEKDKLLTTRSLGETAGVEQHQLSAEEMPAHTHKYTFTNHRGTPKHTDTSSDEFGKSNNPKETTKSGNGQPHNNMPPFVVLKYCERV